MDYAEELDFARSLAREAGEIIGTNFVSGMAKEWKEDGTPLTVTDTTINSMVIERISAAYPEHSVLGEEESHNLGNPYTWVCDPVDGTMPFSHGLPISTFSLALTLDGVPVLGVVMYPFTGQLFWAVKGQGAFCNGEPIHVSSGSMTNALIEVVGFPSTKPAVPAGGIFFDKVVESGARASSLWSAILPSCLVAAGEYAAVVFNVTMPQDGAAIKVIVEEAGGRVTDLLGEEQRYDRPIRGFLASNGVIHDELLGLVQSVLPKD